MAATPKDAQEALSRLQLLEQNLQNVLVQKQQFQTQLYELESALKELHGNQPAYKIIGNIMVATKKEDLEKELQQKKELIDLRLQNLEKQEKQFKDKTKQLQEEVLTSVKNHQAKQV